MIKVITGLLVGAMVAQASVPTQQEEWNDPSLVMQLVKETPYVLDPMGESERKDFYNVGFSDKFYGLTLSLDYALKESIRQKMIPSVDYWGVFYHWLIKENTGSTSKIGFLTFEQHPHPTYKSLVVRMRPMIKPEFRTQEHCEALCKMAKTFVDHYGSKIAVNMPFMGLVWGVDVKQEGESLIKKDIKYFLSHADVTFRGMFFQVHKEDDILFKACQAAGFVESKAPQENVVTFSYFIEEK